MKRYPNRLNETLENRVKNLYEKIRHQEMEEGRDHYGIKGDYNPREFKTIKDRKNFFKPSDEDSGISMKRKKEKEIEDLLNRLEDDYQDDDDIELTEMDGETCECGGEMKEGECMECGSMKEEYDYMTEEDEYDYKEKEFGIGPDVDDEEVMRGYCDEDSPKYNEIACNATKGINERFYGKQRKLDKNKNNKIDAEDFKLIRKNKSKSKKKGGETNEKFPDLSGDGKVTRKDILMGRGVKLGKKKSKVEEGFEYQITDAYGDVIRLTEDEMIDLLENIVNEEKTKLKNPQKPRGLETYEKAHRQSGKENSDYLKSISKKMIDYTKDGSKGKYETNPKHFPKGNGELGKMDKKAFKLTDDLEDFNYEIAGLNIPTPDAIDFNDEWMDNLYKGSSKTGNAPGGNALESDANERFNKLRKKNTLKKLKDQSYKRAPQPIFNEKVGTEIGKGLNIKLESMGNKEKNQINEEFDRIRELLHYNRKTQ